MGIGQLACLASTRCYVWSPRPGAKPDLVVHICNASTEEFQHWAGGLGVHYHLRHIQFKANLGYTRLSPTNTNMQFLRRNCIVTPPWNPFLSWEFFVCLFYHFSLINLHSLYHKRKKITLEHKVGVNGKGRHRKWEKSADIRTTTSVCFVWWWLGLDTRLCTYLQVPDHSAAHSPLMWGDFVCLYFLRQDLK